MADYGDTSEPVTPADEYGPSNPASPGFADDDSEASTPLDPPSSSSDAQPSFSPSEPPRRVPSLRTVSDPQNLTPMNPTSSVTGLLNTARRPAPSANSLPSDIMQKARALQEQRMNMAARAASSAANMNINMNMNMNMGGPGGGSGQPGGMPANLKLPPGMSRPLPPGFPKSAPAVPSARKPPSLSERRAMKLGNLPGSGGSSPSPTPKLGNLGDDTGNQPSVNGEGRGSKLSDFKNYIDADKGWITFDGAATITRTGVNFANGQTFSISLDEIDVMDELGKGNYGTVYKVRHARPKAPRFGQGLSKFKASVPLQSSSESEESPDTSPSGSTGPTTSGVVMAMKEIRLELDQAKFTTILKELVILHECVSPYIIDFYGAFYQEGAVYMCIEYMDGGSIDKLYAGGIPENVLRKITFATIVGLKTLKDDHNIIHRDVKPTNILVNSNGQVKICDFGVSGNLVASIAKTNIGCQSYMAPERIKRRRLSLRRRRPWEHTPIPRDGVEHHFSASLSAIVEGDPPGLPTEGYSALAQDFPETIAEDAEAEAAAADDALADAAGNLSLNHPSGQIAEGDYEVAQWVRDVLERKRKGLLRDAGLKPALHAAPLDTISPVGSPLVGP